MRHATIGSFVLLAAMTAGCASSGAVPRPFPVPGAPPPAAPARTDPLLAGAGSAIASTALGLQGVPYRAGGSDPSGFDCSGLVQYVLAQHGVASPRVVREQSALGHAVKPRDLQPGDLVFFRIEARSISHVGIAIGGDRFVHAPNARGAVRIESLQAEYWARRFAGARRVHWRVE